jgi:diguanylate cyclase (GGDEF)-like protein/PAS domain S-box-containing protein
MVTFIKKSLALKIILALMFIIGLVIGIFTFIDIRMMQTDTIRTSEQNLSALAMAIKGSVNVSMKKGHREDVQRVLEEVKIPALIDLIMIYDEQGAALRSVKTDQRRNGESADLQISPSMLQQIPRGDLTQLSEHAGARYLSYYSPITNEPECFTCHGRQHKLNGILRIDFSLHTMDAFIASRRNRILVWTGIMMATLLTALAALLRLVVYRPVKDLRDAMARAEDGANEPSLSIEGEDELSDLKRSFVNMLSKINALHRTNLEKERELARHQEVMKFRAELKTMFDAMPDGALLIDTDMRIIQSNPRAYALVPGLEDMAAHRIPPEQTREVACPLQGIREVFKERKVCEHACSITLANGEQRHLHSTCAPIFENDRIVYVVGVIRDVTDRIKTEHELEEKRTELLKTNRLLSQIAITDSLTQVYNRRYFDELLYKEMKRYNRRKYSYLSLMMIDIDHFKKLNDMQGHVIGDAVLREIAGLLRDGVRETDTVARYGGEEFAVVMPDTHSDGALYKAETLRKKVQDTEFPGHDGPLHITVSIGVAAYGAGSPDDLVEAADEALYRAKRSGRNAVVVYGQESARDSKKQP